MQEATLENPRSGILMRESPTPKEGRCRGALIGSRSESALAVNRYNLDIRLGMARCHPIDVAQIGNHGLAARMAHAEHHGRHPADDANALGPPRRHAREAEQVDFGRVSL